MTAQTATVVGIVLQVMGALYLVWQAHVTSKRLVNFRADLTYEKFSDTLEGLAQEVGGQFKQQLIGFLALAAGSGFQIYAAVWA